MDDRKATRSEVKKILQLMNQYELVEFEYEEKDGDRSIELSRSAPDSFPPLLEGRSEDVPGKLRAPAVGQLEWQFEDGDDVSEGDVVAVIQAHEDREELIAGRSGVLSDPVSDDHVEYGQHLGSIVPVDHGEDELDDDEEDDE